MLLYKTITEVVEEEIADYFAANLLVPAEMLSLWEDKSNSRIARAFGVPVKCIVKRRRYEIKHELDYLTSEYLSSRKEINVSVPSSPNELTCIAGGRSVHYAGQS
jgi:Zn-dependent peptidase ImmA (M78 family)